MNEVITDLQINKYKVHQIFNFHNLTDNFLKMEHFTKLSCPKHQGMEIYYKI